MRTSGILMHISSLPSPYGIGTMGKDAYNFVDFLKKAGQTYWQILPICPTSFGDSPYQSFSSYAGNPYFIDLDLLESQGYLKPNEYQSLNWGDSSTSIDYGILYKNRYKVLRVAVSCIKKTPPKDFDSFLQEEGHWLSDYALFMALKEHHGNKSWLEWEDKYRFRKKEALANAKEKYKDEIYFWQMVQYLFYKQWERLKKYANNKGVEIIGDLPIYTAMDSVDVWAHSRLFMLDDNLEPTFVAGVPPDAFTADGQLWGNPLYDWQAIKKEDYSWWIDRLDHVSKTYDITRIDHFRGFDSYYAIPAEDTTARNGKWQKGPGLEFFQQIEKALGEVRFIAEDLGYLTPSVVKLVKDTGYPGMKVLQFAFDSQEDSDYLPHNYNKNNVVYTGTHDNDTILGWFEDASKEDTNFAIDYLRLNKDEGYNWGMMKGAWASVADCVIVQMQDILSLGNSARMNVPSTIGTNWKWRATKKQIDDKLAEKVRGIVDLYRRIPRSN